MSQTKNTNSYLSLITSRAAQQIHRKTLQVDYYRIRRRFAFDLPLQTIPKVDVSIKGVPIYPWGLWAMWALEERLFSLGYSAQWNADQAAAQIVRREINAMVHWPRYTDLNEPDLVLGHCVHILTTALHWHFLDDATRENIRKLCEKLVDANLAWSDRKQGPYHTPQQIITAFNADRSVLHNVSLIGLVGLARAARVARHHALNVLDQRVSLFVRALLEKSTQGFTEGSSYDGYVMDFVGNWLHEAGDAAKSETWNRDALCNMLAQPALLSAPGAPMETAPMGDVEPYEMPFYASATAKMLRRWPDAFLAWHLHQLPAEKLRTDTLATLHQFHATLFENMDATAPRVIQTAHAVVLRNQSQQPSMPVAISLPRTPMRHLHDDTGSLVIGAAGKWIISEPGYQQYVTGSEREFTIGPNAHNAPVINGHAQTLRVSHLEKIDENDDCLETCIDMSGCYAKDAGVLRAVRSVWLWHDRHVIVADEIATIGAHEVAYCWHADASASWLQSQRGLAIVTQSIENDHEEFLWITAAGLDFSYQNVNRLRGSRGQMSLGVKASHSESSSRYWWIFTRHHEPVPFQTSPELDAIELDGRRFMISSRDLATITPIP